MGKGMLFAALSGAGNAIAKSAGDYQRFQDEQAMLDKRTEAERSLMKERMALETEKQLRIDEVMRNRNQSDRQAQADRLDAAKTGLINSSMSQRFGGSDAAVADAAAGKTDAPLTSEQTETIRRAKKMEEDALRDDPNITLQAARKTGDLSVKDEISLKRDEERDAIANKRLDQQQAFNEARAKIQDRLAAVAEARAARAEGNQKTQMDKAELQSTRLALSAALKDIGTQEDKIQMKLMDSLLDDKQKAALQKQLASLDQDRKQARAELLKLAGVEPESSKADPGATPKNAWDSATGEIISNGRVIGKASSPEEAKSILAKFNSWQKTADPKKPDPTGDSASFNAAGYSSTQSTIDGAMRGDQKAIAILQQLIDSGETNAAQRQQIAKILGKK